MLLFARRLPEHEHLRRERETFLQLLATSPEFHARAAQE
jgi:hypothetical protein